MVFSADMNMAYVAFNQLNVIYFDISWNDFSRRREHIAEAGLIAHHIIWLRATKQRKDCDRIEQRFKVKCDLHGF